eukprot:SAG31_NODE_3286_length_4460_cov_2.970649_4_plen_77_part_00
MLALQKIFLTASDHLCDAINEGFFIHSRGHTLDDLHQNPKHTAAGWLFLFYFLLLYFFLFFCHLDPSSYVPASRSR